MLEITILENWHCLLRYERMGYEGSNGSLWHPSQKFTWGPWGFFFFFFDILEKSRLGENDQGST